MNESTTDHLYFDVFDGLTAERPYRKEYSSFNALKIMRNDIMEDFEPELFKKIVKMFSK